MGLWPASRFPLEVKPTMVPHQVRLVTLPLLLLLTTVLTTMPLDQVARMRRTTR
jgi:hypothetical protein